MQFGMAWFENCLPKSSTLAPLNFGSLKATFFCWPQQISSWGKVPLKVWCLKKRLAAEDINCWQQKSPPTVPSLAKNSLQSKKKALKRTTILLHQSVYMVQSSFQIGPPKKSLLFCKVLISTTAESLSLFLSNFHGRVYNVNEFLIKKKFLFDIKKIRQSFGSLLEQQI